MLFQIVTLFPEYFESPLQTGLLGKAARRGLIKIRFADPKKWAKDGRADDYPFGGGETMILSYPPLKAALDSFPSRGRTVHLSPQGALWDFRKAKDFAARFPALTLICGRYGGIDGRLIASEADEEISVGDYILNGGEAAALVIIESLFRLLPDAVGNSASLQEESFSQDGLLQCPSFTRPRALEEGPAVPQFLFSGHHQKIKSLRFYISLVRTFALRPDLIPPSLKSRLPPAFSETAKLPEAELSALGLSRKKLKALSEKFAQTQSAEEVVEEAAEAEEAEKAPERKE